MRESTRRRKKASAAFREIGGDDWLKGRMLAALVQGKAALDETLHDLGRMLAEAIMDLEREELSGASYRPSSSLRKWASEPGSVFVGDQKIRVERPRLRGPEGEVALRSYAQLRQPGAFSQELLEQALRGMSAQKYEETVVKSAEAFGVSPSSVSRHLVEATAAQLRAFRERDLSSFRPFAIFIDTIHRGGAAFMVALGIDLAGNKTALGFWEGASENHDMCCELLADLERRGLVLGKKILFITDGGKGIIKALRERFGKKLLHQRCSVHKKRNLERHLPKRYRKEAARRFDAALSQNSYADARAMFKDLEAWLRQINDSAAESLLEAVEELLTLHRLKVPALLRKTLHTTNPIESMFSVVRDAEGNIKRYRGTKMAQRWLAASMLHAEKRFKRVKGHAHIAAVVEAMGDVLDDEMQLPEAA
jgi:putative transposase